jgi:hypothetical protein
MVSGWLPLPDVESTPGSGITTQGDGSGIESRSAR